MITVVLPVLNQYKLTNDLLNCISKNEEKPKEIILIDNGSTEPINELVNSHKNLNIKYIRFNENVGVNPAWNLGIMKSKTHIVSILNNDLLINNYFFKRIKETMIDTNIGVCVPNTISDMYYAMTCKYEPVKIAPCNKREGWAFTIKKDIIEKFGYIPKELNRTYGDDYIFHCARKLNYRTVKMENNYIFHYGSITTVKELKDKGKEFPDKNTEKEIWLKIKQRLEGGEKNVSIT